MKALILRGIPGSGKSVLANRLVEFYTGKRLPIGVFSADNYRMNDRGEYDFMGKPNAHADCFAAFVEFLTDYQRLAGLAVVDNTNIRAYEIAPYVAYAKVCGAEIDIFRVECSVKTAISRNTHAVPEDTIRLMALNIEALPRHWPKEVFVNSDQDLRKISGLFTDGLGVPGDGK